MKSVLYKKLLKIMDSCETTEQLVVAGKWLYLALKQLQQDEDYESSCTEFSRVYREKYDQIVH